MCCSRLFKGMPRLRVPAPEDDEDEPAEGVVGVVGAAPATPSVSDAVKEAVPLVLQSNMSIASQVADVIRRQTWPIT